MKLDPSKKDLEKESKVKNKSEFIRQEDLAPHAPIVKKIKNPMLDIARMLVKLEINDSKNREKEVSKSPEVMSELLTVLNNESDVFLGLIGKCVIDGCDVHILDSNLEIVKHFEVNEQIEIEFTVAREKIKTLPDGVIGIMVFKNKLIYLYLNGAQEVIA